MTVESGIYRGFLQSSASFYECVRFSNKNVDQGWECGLLGRMLAKDTRGFNVMLACGRALL